MTRTVKHLAESIIDDATAIGLMAEGANSDSVFCAEAILCMRDAQANVNKAKDALHRSIAMASGKKPPESAEMFSE